MNSIALHRILVNDFLPGCNANLGNVTRHKPRSSKHCATSWTRTSRHAWAAALLAAFAISGCGGGSEGGPARPARLAAATSPSLLDVDTLLDWGEATYPGL